MKIKVNITPLEAKAEMHRAYKGHPKFNWTETIPDPDYEIEIPDPDWEESEEVPDQPMIVNPIPVTQVPNPMTIDEYINKNVGDYLDGIYRVAMEHKRKTDNPIPKI